MKPINAKKIITVNYTTHAVAKRKPEEIQACRDPNPNFGKDMQKRAIAFGVKRAPKTESFANPRAGFNLIPRTLSSKTG